jgi:hypothetical protein
LKLITVMLTGSGVGVGVGVGENVGDGVGVIIGVGVGVNAGIGGDWTIPDGMDDRPTTIASPLATSPIVLALGRGISAARSSLFLRKIPSNRENTFRALAESASALRLGTDGFAELGNSKWAEVFSSGCPAVVFSATTQLFH